MRAVRKARTGTPCGDEADPAVPEPTTLEGALTAQLVQGLIDQERYRKGLEKLASRDDRAHPLSVPDVGDFSAVG